MRFEKPLKRALWGQLGRPCGRRGRIIGCLMTAANAPAHDLTLAEAGLEPDDRVLEVGFGGGALAEKALRLLPRGVVRGVDASEIMVRAANRRNARAVREGRATFEFGDVSSLPYAVNSFDKVLSVHSIYFWPDPISDLEEILRVLIPGGRFVVTIDPTEPMESPTTEKTGYDHWSRESLLAVLAQAGFVDIGSESREDLRLICTWGHKPD